MWTACIPRRRKLLCGIMDGLRKAVGDPAGRYTEGASEALVLDSAGGIEIC